MPSKRTKSKTKRRSKSTIAASKTQTPRRKRVVKSKTRRKTAPKKTASPASGRRRKRGSISAERETNQDIRSRNLTRTGMVASRQAADLQGLSRAEQADSESVDELVEEGNLFEAGAVAGVEEADNADEREVHTHELPEDDVPEEYLDKE